MNCKLVIKHARWKELFKIPKGSVLHKGRRGLYHDIVNSARTVTQTFGCYSWGSDNAIFYCGSFSKDHSKNRFRTNLEGRVHQYLCNHRLNPETGRRNTNLWVFDNINKALKRSHVFLAHFKFKMLSVGEERLDFDTFSRDPNLVRAVEQLLIGYYSRCSQCKWNRS